MPELPEVEVITRELRSMFKGKRIKEVLVYAERVIRGVSKDEFVKELTGKRVREVIRKGKAILFNVEDLWLIIHLKINGQIYISESKPPWSMIKFRFEGEKRCLYLCDFRGLVEIRLSKDPYKETFLAKMGPDALSEEFTFEYFYSKIKDSRSKIKSLIMDQGFIAGIGNIYAAESLFRAKIRPDRIAKSLSEEEAKKLYVAIKDVLQDSICYGAAVKKYFVDGKDRGDFSDKFLVYNREGQPCRICGEKIVKITLSGRGTYFCPVCQV